MEAVNFPIHSQLNPIQALPTIRSIADLPSVFDMKMPSIEFIVADVIARKTLTILTGEAGSGKTTLITAIAGAVSEGKEFAGIQTILSPVLYVDRENTGPVVLERLYRLRVRDGDRFKYWGGWVGEEPPPLDAPIYAEYVASCNPKPLIIVDSLVAFHPGNENDATETRKFLDQARRLTNLGAAVVMLHHKGKGENSQDYRGSSDIKGSADVAYSLTNSGTSRLEKIQLESFKSRFTTLSNLTLQYNDGIFTTVKRDGASVQLPHQQRLTQLLDTNPGIITGDFEELALGCGIPRQAARSFLTVGVEEGRIMQVPKGPRAKGYTLADPPLISEMIM